MIISPVCKDLSNGSVQPARQFSGRTNTAAAFAMVVLVAFFLGGCSASSSEPTSAPLPTFSSEISLTSTSAPPTIQDSSTTLPTLEPDRVWGERQVGAATAMVKFYSQNALNCIRLAVKDTQSNAIERCEQPGGSVVAVQGNITDAGGQSYTVVAGRVLKDKIAVVSIELDHADNTPAELSDGGFLVVLPGKRTAISVVPIDQFGNLVGARYLFR